MPTNPLFAIDFYKADHRRQYPEGTTEVYSNFTPRYAMPSANILEDFDNQVVVFGIQYFIQKFLIEQWDAHFFNRPVFDVVKEYQDMMYQSLGIECFDCSHIQALHGLGYLPLRIKAIEEGYRVPVGVPVLTVVNTHPDFFWLTNYIETALSASIWKAMTTATKAFEMKRMLISYAQETGCSENDVLFQCHDFSFRGMSGIADAAISGAAHLLSFYGTDTVPAIELINKYYHGHASMGIIGASVPATEHSVMCSLGQKDEFQLVKKLITETYPEGIVSIVADSYNLWEFLTVYLPSLYHEISERQGKVVVRPDSGDPADIICGDVLAAPDTPANKGALRCLWETFGGRINSEGFRVLNPKVGLIYGDAITIDRAKLILDRMKDMGFASTNVIFGVGSYSYQYVTRDTFGFAMKATSIVVDGERRDIFKNPITGDGKKRSHRGLLRVEIDNETARFYCLDQQSTESEKEGDLDEVFVDGAMVNRTTIDKIRANLAIELEGISG